MSDTPEQEPENDLPAQDNYSTSSNLPGFHLTDGDLRDMLLSWLPRLGDRPSLYCSLLPILKQDNPPDETPPEPPDLRSHPLVSSLYSKQSADMLDPDSDLNKEIQKRIQAFLDDALRNGDTPPREIKFDRPKLELDTPPVSYTLLWRYGGYGYGGRSTYTNPTGYDRGNGLTLGDMERILRNGYPEEGE